MSIGGHTLTHPILARSPCEKQWEEILGMRPPPRRRVGRADAAVQLPGRQTELVRRDYPGLSPRGWGADAFSYYHGFRRFADWDDYDIRRVGVESHMTRDLFC